MAGNVGTDWIRVPSETVRISTAFRFSSRTVLKADRGPFTRAREDLFAVFNRGYTVHIGNEMDLVFGVRFVGAEHDAHHKQSEC